MGCGVKDEIEERGTLGKPTEEFLLKVWHTDGHGVVEKN